MKLIDIISEDYLSDQKKALNKAEIYFKILKKKHLRIESSNTNLTWDIVGDVKFDTWVSGNKIFPVIKVRTTKDADPPVKIIVHMDDGEDWEVPRASFGFRMAMWYEYIKDIKNFFRKEGIFLDVQ